MSTSSELLVRAKNTAEATRKFKRFAKGRDLCLVAGSVRLVKERDLAYLDPFFYAAKFKRCER